MIGWNIDDFVEEHKCTVGEKSKLFITKLEEIDMVIQCNGYEVVMDLDNGTFYFNDTSGG